MTAPAHAQTCGAACRKALSRQRARERAVAEAASPPHPVGLAQASLWQGE